MSIQASRATSSALITTAVLGGIIGGIIVDLFLIVVGHQPVPGLWQFVASTLVGPVAFTSVNYAFLGLVLHAITSIFWAILYVFVWRMVSSLSNWLLGGIVWGVVVWAAMTGFLIFRGVPAPATALAIGMGLLAHIVFYALPMTWYVSRSARAL